MAKKIYRVKCKYLDENGKGVVSFNNVLWPVSYLLPGEMAYIEIVRRRQNGQDCGSYARLVSVEQESKERTKPDCDYFFKCGGCQLRHLSYESQLKYKQERVENLFAGLHTVNPIIGMDNHCNYRNKIHATFGSDKRGRKILGIYEENTHHVIPIKDCMIQDKYANEILKTIGQITQKLNIPVYDENKKTGVLRHVLIRRGIKTNQTLVAIVVADMEFRNKEKFIDLLRKSHPDINTIVMNLNNKKTTKVLGDTQAVLYGRGYIEDELCGYRFQISPKSFYQVNPVQTEKLYEKAIEMAKLSGEERVIDAYCGVGTISIILNSKAKDIIGVELNKDAIKDAVSNAKLNNIENIKFYTGDAGEFMLKLGKIKSKKNSLDKKDIDENIQKNSDIDVVFIDPPRSGSDEKFLRSLCKLAPKKVVYISCNPETQKRDIEYMMKNGYKIREIQPVDMFPNCKDVETVILLS